MTTPQEKIREMLDKYATGRYIFRGENDKDYGKISSGLYRQYCQPDGNSSANENGPLIDNEHFFVADVEQGIVEKARQHIRPGASDVEVLTELQHYGGKTALIDFSKDLHIALFFACDGEFDRNGRVIFFETSSLTESTKINYDEISGDKAKHTLMSKHTLISPAGKTPRVIFQSSIFVHVPKGYLLEDEYDIIEIEKDLKKPLLDYLSKHFNIKTETIYNDIQGFIRNQNNYSAAEIEFYRGNANFNSDRLEAIKNYDKAIEINYQFAEAYYKRGLATFLLEDHEESIENVINDFNKAIEINPQYTEAYNNRGNAKIILKNYKDAIADYDKAIEFNIKNSHVYNNTSNISVLFGYYCNRGRAKSALDKPEEAIEDYNQAKTLFAKAGNMEMVKKCEERIAHLENL